jgi:monofunctional glycosyltransferase
LKWRSSEELVDKKMIDFIEQPKLYEKGNVLMKKKIKKQTFLSGILRFILKIHLWFWGIIALLCAIYQFVNPPLTPLMLHRYFVRGYGWHKRYYAPISAIPKRTVRMIMILEDPNFYKHFGFEWRAVRKAYERNQRSGKIRFGASTISNQLARTLFLTTHRNYFRKYLEVQITVIMELIMTKRRMMELYLNYIEWGKGIYGIDTASRYYYGKSIRKLSPNQSMQLVSVLTSPIRHTPQTFYTSRSATQRYNMLQRIY